MNFNGVSCQVSFVILLERLEVGMVENLLGGGSILGVNSEDFLDELNL